MKPWRRRLLLVAGMAACASLAQPLWAGGKRPRAAVAEAETAWDNSGGCPRGGPGPIGPAPVTVNLGGGLTAVKNLTYGTRGGLVLQGDLYVPARLPGRRAPGILVVVHGGGWQDCNRRRPATAWYAQAMARLLHLATFNIEYRLRQEGGAYPENVMDVKCAVQWIAAQAPRYQLDGGRIAIAGESAGGHLATMIGVSQDREDLNPHCGPRPPAVAAAISFSGAYDLPTLARSDSPAKDAPVRYTETLCHTPLSGCDPGRSADRCVDASPLAHACAAKGRFIFVHATDAYDALIPVSQGYAMYQALTAAGRPAQFIVPTDAQVQAEGCRPNNFFKQAHGLVNRCLTTPSGQAVTDALLATIGP